MSEQLKLNPNESNELSFEVLIEGTSTKPIIRFLMQETTGKSEMAYVFPVTKSPDGTLSVVIPKLDSIKEGKSYTGNLEVIVGDQFFTPQSVDISFSKPQKSPLLKIESKGVTVKNHTPSQTSSPKPKKKQFSEYTLEEQAKIRQEMLRRKKLQESKAAEEQKKVIKNMLSSALDDFELG